MAFTAAQRVTIRRHLGWPSRFFQRDPRLETALNSVEQDADTKASVESILAEIATVETRLVDARGVRLQAAQLGTITLRGGGEIADLLREGRRLTGQLAATLEVEIRPGATFGGGRAVDNVIRQG